MRIPSILYPIFHRFMQILPFEVNLGCVRDFIYENKRKDIMMREK